jgi:hypothetical protein
MTYLKIVEKFDGTKPEIAQKSKNYLSERKTHNAINLTKNADDDFGLKSLSLSAYFWQVIAGYLPLV